MRNVAAVCTIVAVNGIVPVYVVNDAPLAVTVTITDVNLLRPVVPDHKPTSIDVAEDLCWKVKLIVRIVLYSFPDGVFVMVNAAMAPDPVTVIAAADVAKTVVVSPLDFFAVMVYEPAVNVVGIVAVNVCNPAWLVPSNVEPLM